MFMIFFIGGKSMQEKLDLLLEDARVKASEIKCEADYLNIKSMFLGKKSLLSEYG